MMRTSAQTVGHAAPNMEAPKLVIESSVTVRLSEDARGDDAVALRFALEGDLEAAEHRTERRRERMRRRNAQHVRGERRVDTRRQHDRSAALGEANERAVDDAALGGELAR